MPLARYQASPYFRGAGFVALAIACFSAWVALRWPYAWIAAGLALASAAVVFSLGLSPRIQIYDSHLKLGRRPIPWTRIRRLDRKLSLPLLVRLTLADRSRIFLVHAGDLASCQSLLRQLQRYSRQALIDGIPHRQFWGEALPVAPAGKQQPPPRPFLLPDDEAEIERLFQRLKSVGHMDSKTAGDENSGEET